jgi:hypothetical protein
MDTKKKISYLSLTMAITAILLIGCFAYFYFNLTADTYNIFRIVISVLFVALLIQLLYRTRLDRKENDRQHKEFLKECNELGDHLERIIKREVICRMYLDSLIVEESNDSEI